MTGFIYIWRDKKHNRYYVGSHWGTEDDGYICSSTWMLQAYRKRPQDFKRRIVARVMTNKRDLLEEEHRWLQMMKPEEMKGLRYYNLKNCKDNFWHCDPDQSLTVKQKIAKTLTGQKQSEETKRKRAESMRKAWAEGRTNGMRGKTHTDEYRARLSEMHKGSAKPAISEKLKKAWNEGRHVGTTGMKFSDETRSKMSESHAKRNVT